MDFDRLLSKLSKQSSVEKGFSLDDLVRNHQLLEEGKNNHVLKNKSHSRTWALLFLLNAALIYFLICSSVNELIPLSLRFYMPNDVLSIFTAGTLTSSYLLAQKIINCYFPSPK